MKNIIKVAFLSSIITAAMVYVILEWRPLRSDLTRSPESTLANTLAPAALALNLSDDERNNIEIYQKYSQGVVNITTVTVAYDFFYRAVPQSGMGSGAVIDPQTRLGQVRVSLVPDPNLRPGAFARADVTVSNADRAVLPQTAVLTDDKGSYVLIVNAQHKVERRAVRVSGIVQNGVTIADGVSSKDQVVATAGAFLQEGELVNPVLKDSSRT